MDVWEPLLASMLYRPTSASKYFDFLLSPAGLLQTRRTDGYLESPDMITLHMRAIFDGWELSLVEDLRRPMSTNSP